MQTVILAGGLGTRLRSRTGELPKPMASVAGRPFLAHLLDRLSAAGLTEIILSVGYRAEAIRHHFGETYRSARLTYAVEAEPLGTGGALAHALRGGGTALALNGDTLLDLDYRAFLAWYQREPVAFALALKKLEDAARYGTVSVAGERVTGFREKGQPGPGLINAGVYIVQAEAGARVGLSGAFSLERDLLERQCAALAPRAYPTDACFIDIGVPEDYDRAQKELAHAGR
ncbi:MAG: nucleotidyltransferase family protein [Betaproteobacteria bacterium]